MKNILILSGRYLPGHKDGGPLRTIINVTDTLGDEYDFYIGCLDRDHGEDEPYPDIKRDEWNKVGKANVWYVSPGGFSNKLILTLAEGKDLIYLCSFYDDYGYKTLMLNRKRKIKCPVALASMGVFAKAALQQKTAKKMIFINICKITGLFNDITWSVSSESEAKDVKRVIGSNIKYVVAEDLPRRNVPGKREKLESNGILKIVFLSRICAHKNLEFAIRAIIGMKQSAEFTIYGPIQEVEYWEKCKELLLKSNLKWSYKGDVPSEEVQEKLSNYDVLLFPSKSENYGHVVFEALSVGCIPVISNQTPWNDIDGKKIGFELPLVENKFSEKLDMIAKMSMDERVEMADRAVFFAKEKVREAAKKTGYRKIFEQGEIA